MNATATKTNAADLYAAITAVDLAAVQTVSRDRCIPRKEQAALARKLFRSLGIKGISVTAPNYSMAQSVEVRLPSETVGDDGHRLDGVDYRDASYSDMPDEVPVKAALLRRRAASNKVQAILNAAFPSHDDRSDTMTDYFDCCWSID